MAAGPSKERRGFVGQDAISQSVPGTWASAPDRITFLEVLAAGLAGALIVVASAAPGTVHRAPGARPVPAGSARGASAPDRRPASS